MCDFFLLVSRSCVIFPPKRFVICCCPERLRDFFVARGWRIFFIPRGCVIFVVPRDCVIFFVPRDCVIFLVLRGCVNFFVQRGCAISFCPNRLHYVIFFCLERLHDFFLSREVACFFFCHKRLRNFWSQTIAWFLWTNLDAIGTNESVIFFIPRGCAIFFLVSRSCVNFPPERLRLFNRSGVAGAVL